MAKLIRIVESDPTYLRNFSAWLIQCGAMPTESPSVLEVTDDFDASAFHGVSIVSETSSAAVDNSDAYAWLNAYTGNFDFYLSLKSQLARKGSLSPKQVDCIRRAMEKIAAPKAWTQAFSLKPGTILRLSSFIARAIAKDNGYATAYAAFEVVEVLRETDKAYQVRAKLTAQRGAWCSCCGRELENPASVTAGIGPVCAEKWGVSFSGESMEELRKRLESVQVLTAWVPKSCIKEKVSA